MTSLKQPKAHSNTLVRVSAPARLHLGFLDLNGESGRKFGSIGLAIHSFNTTVEAHFSSSTTTILPEDKQKKVSSIIDSFYASLGSHIPDEQRNIAINLTEMIPEHAGFGSGTQLALTIGSALCKLHHIPATTREIAEQLGRGARSGIGIATFDLGGFIIDGGLASTSTVPPLLARYEFPSAWQMVLILDNGHQGMHGDDELNAFKTLPIFPLNASQTICHLTLMKLLPALVEQNITDFGQAITQIQSLIGDHFAPAQGGRYASNKVGALLRYAQRLGHKGISQSSWGPTGCVFVDSKQSADELVNKFQDYLNTEHKNDISFSITSANSKGADIEIL